MAAALKVLRHLFLETFDHWVEDGLLRIRDFIDAQAHLVADLAVLRAQVDDSDLVRT